MLKKMMYIAAATLLGVTLHAKAVDSEIIEFEKKRFEANKQIVLKNVELYFKQELDLKNWSAFILNIDAVYQGQDVRFKDVLFSNGEYVTPELIDLKSGRSLKSSIAPELDESFYDEQHLILGNANAKNRIVVFSDPLCPFCMDYIPDVIKHVKKYEKSIALYYYHYPLLQIHPASQALSKLMHVAFEKGVEDVFLRTYEAYWDEYFDENEKDEAKILKAFNKVMNTQITLEEIQNEAIQEVVFGDLAKGEDAMVQGTPTIFVNGKLDGTKTKFLELGK
jgi:protein-disulfide isomerase